MDNHQHQQYTTIARAISALRVACETPRPQFLRCCGKDMGVMVRGLDVERGTVLNLACETCGARMRWRELEGPIWGRGIVEYEA